MADLASADGVDLDEIERRLQLAYLSPAVTVAIVEGRQDQSLKLEHLTTQMLSPAWAEQASKFLAPTDG